MSISHCLGLALCFALAAAFVAPRTAVVVSPSRLSAAPSRLSAAPSRRSAAPRRRSSARFASDDDDDVDFEAAFKARVADDGGALGVKAKVLKNEAGRTASSVASSARDATRSSGQKVAKGLGLEPLTRRESAGTAAEEADLLTAGGWAATVGALGLIVVFACYTQSQIDPDLWTQPV